MAEDVAQSRLNTIVENANKKIELKMQEKRDILEAQKKLDRAKVYEIYRHNLTQADIVKHCTILKQMADAGDLKAMDFLYRIVGEFAPQQIEAVNLNIDYAQYLKSLEGEEF